MADSEFLAILKEVAADIEAASLTSWVAGRCYVRKFPTERDAEFPCIFVFPQPERIEVFTNNSYKKGYGVGIACCGRSNNTLAINADADLLLSWRDTLLDRYADHGSDTLTANGVFQTIVEPQTPIIPQAFKKNFDASALLLRCWVKRNT